MKHNYNKDKKGWVSFSNKMNKVKLRKYISDLAKRMEKYSDDSFLEIKKLLIKCYNDDGLNGVRNGANIIMVGYAKTKEEIKL